jgi:hypothetical protein
LPAMAGVLWSTMRWVEWRRGATSRISGELCLRKVDALDHRRQHVLLSAQLSSGLLKR